MLQCAVKTAFWNYMASSLTMEGKKKKTKLKYLKTYTKLLRDDHDIPLNLKTDVTVFINQILQI